MSISKVGYRAQRPSQSWSSPVYFLGLSPLRISFSLGLDPFSLGLLLSIRLTRSIPIGLVPSIGLDPFK